MKQGKTWLRRLMPLMVLVFLCFGQSAFAQDDYSDTNSGSGYDNNDEALIQPEGDVNYNTFHDELSPYGNWMNYPGYGNVWVANIPGFRPYYTGGHWAYTHYGWTWASDFNWGWAPFHYGRWAFDASYGWFWVPGYTWGPAWVSWRNGGDYYGWAPLSPGLSVGFNIGIGIPANDWVFLPHRYMGYRSLNPYYVDRGRNITIIRNTTIINNTNVFGQHRYFEGPRRNDVERYSGRRIQEQNIVVANRRNGITQDRNGSSAYNPRSNYNNNNIQNNNRQDNVRQQPNGRQYLQNRGVQQSGDVSDDVRKRPVRERQHNDQNTANDASQDQVPRQQRMQQRMQQQQDNQRNQQVQQQMNDRQQQMEQRRQQDVQQQQDVQRQQQIQQHDQGQMNQQRQQQIQQHDQGQMNQQRQQQMQQRQQQMQQRQQVFPQRQENRTSNPPVQQQRSGDGGGRGRRNK